MRRWGVGATSSSVCGRAGERWQAVRARREAARGALVSAGPSHKLLTGSWPRLSLRRNTEECPNYGEFTAFFVRICVTLQKRLIAIRCFMSEH